MNEIIPLWAEGAPGFEAGYGQPQPFLQAYPLPGRARRRAHPAGRRVSSPGAIRGRTRRAGHAARGAVRVRAALPPCAVCLARAAPGRAARAAAGSGPFGRGGRRPTSRGGNGFFGRRTPGGHVGHRIRRRHSRCGRPVERRSAVRTRWRCAIRSSAWQAFVSEASLQNLTGHKTLRLRCGARCPWKNASRPIRRPPFYGIRRTMRTSRWKTA